MTVQKYWSGTPGSLDDFGRPIDNVFIDGKTQMGPWATMAPDSYSLLGVGLGLGRGQRYEKQADGRWRKVEG